MKSVSTTPDTVARNSRTAQLGSSPIALLVGSLIAATIFLQPATHPATQSSSANNTADFISSAVKARDKASSLAELEQAFWICDQAMTKQGIDIHQAVTCATVTDELRRAKFGGDSEKLIEWWRISKIA